MIDHIQPINIDKVWFSSRISNTILSLEKLCQLKQSKRCFWASCCIRYMPLESWHLITLQMAIGWLWATHPWLALSTLLWNGLIWFRHQTFHVPNKSRLMTVLGQVDFLAGQVTFKAYLLNGQRSKQVILTTKSLKLFITIFLYRDLS